MGRPRKYSNEEERKKAIQESRKNTFPIKSGDALNVVISITQWPENGIISKLKNTLRTPK